MRRIAAGDRRDWLIADPDRIRSIESSSRQSLTVRSFLTPRRGTPPRQRRLNLEAAKLSEGFFEQLRRHPVPIEEGP
jgi:hypothetical protein